MTDVSLRVGLAQIGSTADPAENLRMVAAEVEHAVRSGANLVVFPEATMCRFGARSLTEVAEPISGPWVRQVAELADAHGVTIVVGMFTPATRGRVRNTVVIAAPGDVVSYDKIHLFDAFGVRESDEVEAGVEPLIVSIGGMNVGVATCYDIRFPELFAELAAAGAHLIVVPTSWAPGPGKAEQWDLLTRARALDSTCWIVACDQAPPLGGVVIPDSPGPIGIGESRVVRPDGTLECGLGVEPGRLVVEVSVAQVDRARLSIPVLHNRQVMQPVRHWTPLSQGTSPAP